MKLDLTNMVSEPVETIPSWLPCYHCRKPLSAHIDSKCPFEASSFNPSDSKLIHEALYEMRRMQARRSPDVNKRLAYIADAQEQDYRLALDIVMDRWLKDFGIK